MHLFYLYHFSSPSFLSLFLRQCHHLYSHHYIFFLSLPSGFFLYCLLHCFLDNVITYIHTFTSWLSVNTPLFLICLSLSLISRIPSNYFFQFKNSLFSTVTISLLFFIVPTRSNYIISGKFFPYTLPCLESQNLKLMPRKVPRNWSFC